MASRGAWHLTKVVGLAGALSACQQPLPRFVPGAPVAQPPTGPSALGPILPLSSYQGPTGTVRLQLPARSAARPLLAFEQSQRLRLIFQGPDLDAAITTPATDAFPGSLLTFTGVPVGPVRLLGLEWLGPDDKPLNGAPQWAVGSVVEGNDNAMAVTPANQVAGEALLSLLGQDKAAAGKVVPKDLVALLLRAQAELKLADVRMVPPGAVATSLKGGGGVPSTVPAAWASGSLGQVSVRATDWPPSMNVRLLLNDSLSTEVILSKPDTVLLGPVPARAEPYQVRAVPLDIDGLDSFVNAPWAPNPVSVTVFAGQATQVAFSFASSTAGAALPLRLAPATSGSVQVNGQPELWLLGGVTAPAALDGQASPPANAEGAVVQPYLKALRYRRAGGWTEVISLPAGGLPKLMTAVGVGSDLYLFGGLDGSTASTKVWKLAAGAVPPTLTALPGAMPVGLVAAAGGVVGDRILLAGGLRTDGTPYPGVLAFTPSSGVCAEEVASGNPDPLMDAAGVGLNNRLYLFGGFRPGAVGAAVPSNRSLAYDAGSKDFRNLRRMPTARRGGSALLHAGKLYVVGGDAHRGTPTSAVEAFDPNVARWAHSPPLRVPRGRPGVVLIPTLEGLPRILVAGGGLGMPTAFTGESPVAASAVEELVP